NCGLAGREADAHVRAAALPLAMPVGTMLAPGGVVAEGRDVACTLRPAVRPALSGDDALAAPERPGLEVLGRERKQARDEIVLEVEARRDRQQPLVDLGARD